MNTDHVIIRNESLFCSHCGQKQGISVPIKIEVFSAMAKAFSKNHAACERTWEEPTPDETASELENRNRWLKEGERGISSEAIFSFFTGVPLSGKWGLCPPSDPDDFRRCYLLLKFVPSWRSRIAEIGSVSPVWAALAENWDKLTELLEEQMETRKPNGMYELMKSLGC